MARVHPSAEPQKRPGKDRPRPRLAWRLVKWTFILGLLGALLAAAGVGGLFLWFGRDSALPLRDLADYVELTRRFDSEERSR